MQESLESRAYEKIRSDIVSAALTSGVLLSENEISSHLGISRTPVHSAITRLEEEGFLESLPRRGFMVKDISFTEFFDMQETIVSMELYSLARLSDNKSIDMRTLRMDLDTQAAALESGDNMAYYEAGLDFASTILAASGNKVMLGVLAQFRDKMLCKVLNYRKTRSDFKPSLSRNRNERIFDALARGDVMEAQTVLLHTMVNAREFLHAWA